MSQIWYWEDWQPGIAEVFGEVAVTAEGIKTFARRYDPQPFHLDEAAAQQSVFKGLAASGWHTAAMTMRMIISQAPHSIASLGSPGLDDLRWLKPVRPGDKLHVRLQCVEKRPSKTHPQRGSASFLVETLNQADEVVMHMTLGALVARRAS